MATKTRKLKFMDVLMAEPIRLPGCPDVIVSRGWCYQWLKNMGYPLQGGFGSVDYMVFGRDIATRERETLTLSNLSEPWIVKLLARMEQDCVSA
jgi:hypothetical protein